MSILNLNLQNIIPVGELVMTANFCLKNLGWKQVQFWQFVSVESKIDDSNTTLLLTDVAVQPVTCVVWL